MAVRAALAACLAVLLAAARPGLFFAWLILGPVLALFVGDLSRAQLAGASTWRGSASALVLFFLPLLAFGWLASGWSPPAKLALGAGAALLASALAEEWFFRGYLQPVFEATWTARVRLAGASCGYGLPLAATCFAAAHLPRHGLEGATLVLAPGLLLGWCRARWNSIIPGWLLHAGWNWWWLGT